MEAIRTLRRSLDAIVTGNCLKTMIELSAHDLVNSNLRWKVGKSGVKYEVMKGKKDTNDRMRGKWRNGDESDQIR